MFLIEKTYSRRNDLHIEMKLKWENGEWILYAFQVPGSKIRWQSVLSEKKSLIYLNCQKSDPGTK